MACLLRICRSDEQIQLVPQEPMKDLTTLACVFGMVAAVLLSVFFGIVLVRTFYSTGTTMPVTL